MIRANLRRMAGSVVWVLCCALISACAVGPNFKAPKVDSPPAFRDVAGSDVPPPETTSLADLPWWELFQDPVLEGLIREGLTSNYDLRIIATRVEQARYAVGVTRADLMPQAGYGGSAARGRSFNPVGSNFTENTFFGAFQLAWEIDVWGRIRRATEASLADLFATEDVQRGVILSLVTGIAQAYFELRELDLELEIARRTRDSFQQTLDLFTRRLRGGVDTKLATSRAAAALASTAATIPEIERQIVAKENQLSILLGRTPGSIPRGAALTAQPAAPDVPPGVPASLLERRPDILQAEQNVVATNALVGVAIANFLPRIGLTTFYGGQSTELENLVKGPGNVWAIGGSLMGPIFQGGRLYYNYMGSVAAWDEAQLAYQRTVLIALGEVSNALVARQRFAEAGVQLELQVAALQESVRLSTLRYEGGLATYYEVLEAQQQLFPAENQLAQTQRNQLVALVQLYRTLGGGWRAEENAYPDRYPQPREALDALVPVDGRRAQP